MSLSLFDNIVKDDLDQWIFSIKNNYVRKRFNAIGINELKKGLRYLAMSPEERQRYNQFLNENASLKGAISFAEKKGRAEARAEVREEVREEVRKEVRKEEAISKDTAYIKNMASEGLSLDTISRVSGLSIQKIEEILKKLKSTK